MTKAERQVSLEIKAALDSMLLNTVPLVDTDTLADVMANKAEWVILDSRELIEFQISHLPQARWVGFKGFSISAVTDIAKDTHIVVYCSIGVRSEKIAEKLIANGFSNVWNLYGGIFSWANQHRPLVADDQQVTLKVHGYDEKWAKLVINPYF